MSAETVLNVVLFFANLAIFGFNLKLYTEILKAQAQDKRRAPESVER